MNEKEHIKFLRNDKNFNKRIGLNSIVYFTALSVYSILSWNKEYRENYFNVPEDFMEIIQKYTPPIDSLINKSNYKFPNEIGDAVK